MDTTRYVALSDMVFAVVAVACGLGLAVPELLNPTDEKILAALHDLIPLFLGYAVSVLILAQAWITHTLFLGVLGRHAHRVLVLLGLLYLALIALMPFSTHLLGSYLGMSAAVFVYGINVLLIGIVAAIAFQFAVVSESIDTDATTKGALLRLRVRSLIAPVSALIGLSVVGVSGYLALACFVVPLAFTLVPSLLDRIVEKLGLV